MIRNNRAVFMFAQFILFALFGRLTFSFYQLHYILQKLYYFDPHFKFRATKLVTSDKTWTRQMTNARAQIANDCKLKCSPIYTCFKLYKSFEKLALTVLLLYSVMLII
jgi:hypothetical protein